MHKHNQRLFNQAIKLAVLLMCASGVSFMLACEESPLSTMDSDGGETMSGMNGGEMGERMNTGGMNTGGMNTGGMSAGEMVTPLGYLEPTPQCSQRGTFLDVNQFEGPGDQYPAPILNVECTDSTLVV